MISVKKYLPTRLITLALVLMLILSMSAIPAFAANDQTAKSQVTSTGKLSLPESKSDKSKSDKPNSVEPTYTGDCGTINYMMNATGTAGQPVTGYVSVQSSKGSILGGQVTIWWGDNTNPGNYSIPASISGSVQFPVGHIFTNPGTYTTTAVGYVYTLLGGKCTIIPIEVTVRVS